MTPQAVDFARAAELADRLGVNPAKVGLEQQRQAATWIQTASLAFSEGRSAAGLRALAIGLERLGAKARGGRKAP